MDKQVIEEIINDIHNMTDEEMIKEMTEQGCIQIPVTFSQIEDYLITNRNEAELILSLGETSDLARNLAQSYGDAVIYNDPAAAKDFESLWQDWLIERKNYE